MGKAQSSKKKGTSKKTDRSLVDILWNTFKSMRFAIIVLILITIATVFNLFANEFIIPTSGDPAYASSVYHRVYDPLRANLLLAFQMYAPYSSWWYTTLLGILTLSLLVCSIDRFPHAWSLATKPHFVRDPKLIRSIQGSRRLELEKPPDNMDKILARSGYRTWTETNETTTVISAKKYSWASFGAWFVHVGFIFLVIGGAMIARGTYRVSVSGLPGEMLLDNENEWGFNVRVDDFQIEYYPLSDGQWAQVNRLEFEVNGQEMAIDTLLIGKLIGPNEDGSFNVDVFSPARTYLRNIPADNISSRIDWVPRQGGRLDQMNISDYIATLTVFENGDSVTTRRVEVNYPLRYKGYRFYQASFDDRRTDAQGRWTTVLTVRKDPGAPYVWVGITIVSLGLIFSMYIIPRELYMVFSRDGEKTILDIAGFTKRNRLIIPSEIEKYIKRLPVK